LLMAAVDTVARYFTKETFTPMQLSITILWTIGTFQATRRRKIHRPATVRQLWTLIT